LPVQCWRMNLHLKRAVAALTSLVIILAVVPTLQASVPILEWAEVDIPGDNDLTVVSPSEVTGIAAGRNGLVYAVDGENGRMYRSLEYALEWEDITTYLERAGVTLPATLVAVAPDNEGIVAVLADGGTSVWVSLDGGYEWENTQLPAVSGEVTALALSSLYVEGDREYREIAVGTASWGDGLSNGEVYVLQGGCTWSFWRLQELTVDSTVPVHLGADVATLAYSPDYSRDHTLLVVCSTGAEATLDVGLQDTTFLCLGERDVDNGGTDWGFLNPDYPLEIIEAGDAAGVSYVRSTLALPSSYSSENTVTRSAFVSIEREPDYDDDVYRVVGDAAERMDVDGGADIDIWSIAYRGTHTSGVLLAGDREPTAPLALNVQVRRCEEPFEALPDWQESDVPPTGPGHAVLVWARNVSLAYCGTSSQPGVALDESAFSASTYGNLWRQMALIDTSFTLTDIVVSPDGEKLFLTTANPWGPESVWDSFSDPLGYRWERILTVDSVTGCVMVKLSAGYESDDTVVVAEHNGDLVAVSHDRGNSWVWRWPSPEPLLDVIVVDEHTLIAAIPGGMVMQSTNGGKSWEDAVESQLNEVNMLSMAADGTLFAGSRDGYVSYSTDGGGSFVRIEEPVGDGDVQVTPDAQFADNGWIYAAASGPDDGLWRWRLGISGYWQQLDDDITQLADGQRIGGLLTGEEGTLYALRTEPAGDVTGGMTRWLCPACDPCADFEYDHVHEGLPDGASFVSAAEFTTSYPAGTLWGDDELNDIYAIDSAGQHIFLYRDTLCKRGPYLYSPEDGSHLDENPCDCNRDPVVLFDWECVEGVNQYQAGFYHDASLAEWLWSVQTDCNEFTKSPADGAPVEFQSGVTYGWRVRTTLPVLSPWSDMWTLYPRLLEVSGLQPAAGATGVDGRPTFTWDGPGMAEAYEFALATDPDFGEIVAAFEGATALDRTAWVCDRDLPSGTNYFWRVRSLSGQACSPWASSAFTTSSVTVSPTAAGAESLDLPEMQPLVSSYLVWMIFGLVALLMVGLIVLILRTARR
jgi:photosystem II stability/assembly factor-like uncharacterized protein